MSVTIDPADIEALETAAEALIRAQGVSEASVRLLALALRFRAETGFRRPRRTTSSNYERRPIMAPENPGRYVTDEERDPRERYSLYRLCECSACGGSGKASANEVSHGYVRCTTCRGEGKQRDELAACETPEAIGVALVTLAREGEWRDENGDPCALGLLDRQGAKGQKWLILPWKASARNVRDAAKTMRAAQS